MIIAHLVYTCSLAFHAMPPRRRVITAETKIQIIRERESGTSLDSICESFGLPKSTVCTIWSNREKLSVEAPGDQAQQCRRSLSVDHMEEQLVLSLNHSWLEGVHLSHTEVRGLALSLQRDFVRQVSGVVEGGSPPISFKASKGWLDRFIRKHAADLPPTYLPGYVECSGSETEDAKTAEVSSPSISLPVTPVLSPQQTSPPSPEPSCSPVPGPSGIRRLTVQQLSQLDSTLVTFVNQRAGISKDPVTEDQLREMALKEAGYLIGGDYTPVNVCELSFPPGFVTNFKSRCGGYLHTQSNVLNVDASKVLIQDLDTGALSIERSAVGTAAVCSVSSSSSSTSPTSPAIAVEEPADAPAATAGGVEAASEAPVRGEYWEREGRNLSLGVLRDFDSFRSQFIQLIGGFRSPGNAVDCAFGVLDYFESTYLTGFRVAVQPESSPVENVQLCATETLDNPDN